MARAPVFTETYRSYLQQLEGVDLARRAGPLGVTFADGGLAILKSLPLDILAQLGNVQPQGDALFPFQAGVCLGNIEKMSEVMAVTGEVDCPGLFRFVEFDIDVDTAEADVRVYRDNSLT